MPSEITVRPAIPEDTEAMATIAVAAWEPVYASFRTIMGDRLFDTVHPDWQEEKAGQIRRAATDDSRVAFLVAEIDGKIAGFVSWIIRTGADGVSIAEIGNNAVDPGYQNRGIATAFYEQVLSRCRAAGAAAVQVTTGLDPSHAPARRAYEKAGFAHGIPMVTYWQEL